MVGTPWKGGSELIVEGHFCLGIALLLYCVDVFGVEWHSLCIMYFGIMGVVLMIEDWITEIHTYFATVA